MAITLPLLILVIPLFMFLFLGLLGPKMSPKLAGTLGSLGLGTVLVMSYIVAFTYFFSGNPEFITADSVRLQYEVFNVTWLQFTQNLVIKLGFFLDPISAMMLVVISTVSFMVHIYSLGYMHGERGFQRYYAFLSLFSFSMLGLVVATNISRCISSGSLWVCRHTSLSDSTISVRQPFRPRRRRLSSPVSPTSASLSVF